MKRPSTWYSGTRHWSRIVFAYGAVTHYGRPFQAASANEPICNSTREPQLPPDGPTTPRLQRLRPITQPRFGLLRFRSPLLTECSLFLEVLRCFSSLGVLAAVYVFNRASQGITPGGFPHSDISGSTLARNSPKHFAACHVLHRLLAPRHPPHALSSLTYSVHAASTVLAGHERLRSRRNLLDEIDASILRLVSVARRSPAASAESADRWARRGVTRSGQRTDSDVGFHTDREDDPEGHLAKVKGV